jgi:nitric oxide dioxygenase
VYRDRETRPGGWRGTRPFVVSRREQESDVITSFYLRPQDGGALLAYEPGQYLTLVLNVDGESVRRNYSLSCAPNREHYRISVKREPGGRVSNYLHDRVSRGAVLDVLPPCGEFVLGESSQRPLVMVSGGVGITPVLSMLEAAAPSGRRIEFIHAARNGRTHAFREEVDALADRHPNVRRYYVYDEPLPGDRAHATGLVTTELLAGLLPKDRDVDFRFLGPKPFMRNIFASAKALGVPASLIRYEFFGPLEALEAA